MRNRKTPAIYAEFQCRACKEVYNITGKHGDSFLNWIDIQIETIQIDWQCPECKTRQKVAANTI